MKPIRTTGDPEAIMATAIERLQREFEYPFLIPPGTPPNQGGGGGMAHYLFVSTSEPAEVQAKADFVIAQDNAGPMLQGVFDSLPATPMSLWFAGIFNIGTTDITFPSRAWIRGLGYTTPGSA